MQQKYFWKTIEYSGITIGIVGLLFMAAQQSGIDVEQLNTLFLEWTAKIGMLLLALLLFNKNIGLLPANIKGSKILKRTIPYQRELGLAVNYYFLSHAMMATYQVIFQWNQLLYQLASIIIPLIGFAFLWITSYKPIQIKIKGWKKMQSIIWLITPLIAMHEFLITKSLSKVTICSLILIIFSLACNLLFSKKKQRGCKQLLYLSIAIAITIIQCGVTTVLRVVQEEQQLLGNGEAVTNNEEEIAVETEEVIEQPMYLDGVYQETVRGYKDGLTIALTITDDQIVAIEILESFETERYARAVFDEIPPKIIATQTTEVSNISGATRTTQGIKQAVEQALIQAKNPLHQ